MASMYKASHKYIRITPRKLGEIADMVRGKNVGAALNYLQMSPRRRTAGVVSQVIKSALATADKKGTVDVDQLVVKEILVGKGPTLKRFMPRAKGSGFPILKYSSHLFVKLGEI